MIRSLKVLQSVIWFVVFIVFSVVIHELSHAIVALCFGNKIIGFGILFKNDIVSIINLCVYCRIDYINPSSRVFVSIGGSLGNVVICLCCFFFSAKKRYYTLFISSFVMIFVELLYWTISPFFSFGDAYNIYESLKITDYSYLFSIVFISVLIAFIVVFAKILEKMRIEYKTKKGMLGLKQFDKLEATEIRNSRVWKNLTDEEIVKIQLFQNRFCFPTVVFHKALENLFGCSILADDLRYLIKLREEYLSSGDNHTTEKFVKLIPKVI